MSQDGPNDADNGEQKQQPVPKNKSGKTRDWCWTYYTDEEGWIPPQQPSETYTIFQWEICPTSGRRHAQGFSQFRNPRALGGLKKWINAHFELREGSAQEASDYCEKPDTREDPNAVPFVRGVLTQGDRPGKRNDLEAVKQAIQNGATKRQLLEEHSDIMAKYPKFIHDYQELHSPNLREDIKDWILKPWQQWLWDLLEGPVDDRAIYWIYDKKGGKGKSWFSNLLLQEKDCFYSNGGKANDLLYAYAGEPIVLFDYARDYETYVGYGPMEQMKNGIFFSSKYSSQMKRFKVPHVIVFANFMIDKNKLSADRIHVIDVHENGEVWWSKPHTPIKERIE